jgi:polar amino acid transport system substrate-binding protein
LLSKDSFLAAMSHNLRTPLNSIIGFTDILLAKIPGSLNEEQEKQLQIVSRCSRQLLVLIRQLLDVGLIQHDKLDPVIDNFDINQIISNVIQEIKPLADQKKIELSATYVKGQLFIRTDKKLIRQVIVNLLDNAIKYTDKGSVSVIEEIRKNSSGDLLEIRVIDTGCGIRESDLTDIFKLYTTVSKKDDPYGEHTGLGLMLCCKYCELLGMKLTCESTFGKGTTFVIHIPLETKS